MRTLLNNWLVQVIVFFCYLFMLGAFDGATEYFDK